MKKTTLLFAAGRLLVAGILALTAYSRGFAQGRHPMDDGTSEEHSSPMGVTIGAHGGLVLTAARGAFPSLLVGTEAQRGTGDIPQTYAGSGTGSRYGLGVMVPLSSAISVGFDADLMRYVAQYVGDSTHVPTSFQAQTSQIVPEVQWNVFQDRASYRRGGLRSIYLAAGLDIQMATIANRVSTSSYPDSGSNRPVAAEGSFMGGDPFRTLLALRGAVGMRFAADVHWEVTAEASYAHSLNTVFSKDAVPNTDFFVDNMGVLVGLAYRF